MRKKVIISPIAQWKIEELLAYLEQNWSVQSKENFLQVLLNAFDQVSNNSRIAPESLEVPNLYKKVVTKQTSFYYRIMSNVVEVVDLIDNRQNPDLVKNGLESFD